jgi:hypothetical protein
MVSNSESSLWVIPLRMDAMKRAMAAMEMVTEEG